MKKAVLVALALAVLGALATYAAKLPDETPSSSATGQISGPRSYSDGTFLGDVSETPYGPVQIEVVVTGGKITDVIHLQMPKGDARAREITAFSSSKLEANTLKAQSADIDFISGATATSYGYQKSLQAALDRAAGSVLITPSKQRS